MPYFERKPWQESLNNVPQQPGDDIGTDVDFVAAARSILTREAKRKSGDVEPFQSRQAVRPGQLTKIVLSITATSGTAPVSLTFSCDGLRNEDGEMIASDHIGFHPEQIIVAPEGRQVLEVRVAVPEQTQPGTYRGKVVGIGQEHSEFDVAFLVSDGA